MFRAENIPEKDIVQRAVEEWMEYNEAKAGEQKMGGGITRVAKPKEW